MTQIRESLAAAARFEFMAVSVRAAKALGSVVSELSRCACLLWLFLDQMNMT